MRVVGIGPGDRSCISLRALEAINQAEIIVGYSKYIGLIRDNIPPSAQVVSYSMGSEVERARHAIQRACQGLRVVVISSGDPGIYGMAGLILELAESMNIDLDIDIIPGISSASAAAARLGAPLMCDHAVISLSDLIVPWESIEEKLHAIAASDIVIVFYNPKSTSRTKPWENALRILLGYRPRDTPVGIVRNAYRKGELVRFTNLGRVMEENVDMNTIVIIGSSKTIRGKYGMVTRRGYLNALGRLINNNKSKV